MGNLNKLYELSSRLKYNSLMFINLNTCILNCRILCLGLKTSVIIFHLNFRMRIDFGRDFG